MGLDVRYDDNGCEGVLIRQELRDTKRALDPVLPFGIGAGVGGMLMLLSGEPGLSIALAVVAGIAAAAVQSTASGKARVEVKEPFTVRDGVLRLETEQRVHTVDLADATITALGRGLHVRPVGGLPIALEWDGPMVGEIEALKNALESAGRRAAATRGSAQDVPRALAKLTE